MSWEKWPKALFHKSQKNKSQTPKKLQIPSTKPQRSSKIQTSNWLIHKIVLAAFLLVFDVSLELGTWCLKFSLGRLLHLHKRDSIFALGFALEEAAIGFGEEF